MIDKGKKKDRFFNISNGYRIKRSPQSRLVSIQKNSISLQQIIFKKKGYDPKNIKINEDERNMLDFIRKCLIIDPLERLTCNDALNHPWFSNVREKLRIEKELSNYYKNENIYQYINDDIVFEVN